MNNSFDFILRQLPYTEPFLFVNNLLEIDAQPCIVNYTYLKDAYFYKGHFKNYPITPGVILTETMAQIGLVCLGIYLLTEQQNDSKRTGKDLSETSVVPSNIELALSSTSIDFFLPVFPGEKVTVRSKKQYFRFNKLKCDVEMSNDKGELVSRGSIAGMMKNA